MQWRVIASLSFIILIVGLGVGLLFTPFIVMAASGSVIQTSYNDFTQCTVLTGTIPAPLLTNTQVNFLHDGQVLLASFSDDFNNSPLDSHWETGLWGSTSYTPTISNSILTLPAAITDTEGGWVRSTDTYTHGILDAVAEFTPGKYQHIGFTPDGGLDISAYYLIFSTDLNDGNLYARVGNGSFSNQQLFNLGTIPTGMHHYGIDWSALNGSQDQITFYLDGLLQTQFSVTNTNMSNFHLYLSNNSTGTLKIDYVQTEPPYATNGSYTSCALDAGVGDGWQTVSWDAIQSVQNNLNVEARVSDNGSIWSNWQSVSNGGVINKLGRYAQYRLNMSSSNTLTTPLVNSVTLNFNTAPTLSISNASVTESTGVSVNSVFTVTLSNPISQTVTVNYATANGTAVSPGDYVGATGTLTFTPGITTQTIAVAVQGDTLDEASENFFVNLSSATNADITDGQGQGTITDNDPSPNLSINNVSMTEGSNGTVNAKFTVSLSAPSGQTVTMNYATANATAIAPGDYITATGTLTFTPGVLTQTITVMINGDGTTEADETFLVNLSGATNATISPPGQGTGTILNDDIPGVAVIQSSSSTNVTEAGATDSYQVYLTNQPSAKVDITLTPNGQITTLPISLTFTSINWFVPQTVTVTAVNDDNIESNPHNGTITHTVTSTDINYNNLSVPNVTVSITDNDFAGVVLTQSGGSTNVVEGGATDTYQVKLTGKPSANVVITPSLNGQTTTLPTSLTFTTLNWNVPQTVTVTAVDDNISESSPHTSIITQAVTSADTHYNGFAIPNVTINITDNDVKLFLPFVIK